MTGALTGGVELHDEVRVVLDGLLDGVSREHHHGLLGCDIGRTCHLREGKQQRCGQNGRTSKPEKLHGELAEALASCANRYVETWRGGDSACFVQSAAQQVCRGREWIEHERLEREENRKVEKK